MNKILLGLLGAIIVLTCLFFGIFYLTSRIADTPNIQTTLSDNQDSCYERYIIFKNYTPVFKAELRGDTLTIDPSGLDSLAGRARVIVAEGRIYEIQDWRGVAIDWDSVWLKGDTMRLERGARKLFKFHPIAYAGTQECPMMADSNISHFPDHSKIPNK